MAYEYIFSICFFVLTYQFCNGESVNIQDLNELKRVVKVLKEEFLEEKSLRKNLERENKDLQNRLHDVEIELKETRSRLNEIEKSFDSEKLKQQNFKDNTTRNNAVFGAKPLGIGPNNSTGNIPNTNQDENSETQKIRTGPPSAVFRRNIATTQIAFYAYEVVDRFNLGYHQTLVYKNVMTNKGNGYHQPTGEFTCDVPGIYVFFSSVLVFPNVYLHTVITKNGVDVAWSYVAGYSAHNQSNGIAIVHLNAGDRVWVRVTELHPADGQDVSDGYENSFSGFLLYGDDA